MRTKTKRPISLILVMVMLLSTFTMYAPAYGTGNGRGGCCENVLHWVPFTQREGENIIPEYLVNGHNYIFIKETLYTTNWNKKKVGEVGDYWFQIEDTSKLPPTPNGTTHTLLFTHEINYSQWEFSTIHGIDLEVLDDRYPVAMDKELTIQEDGNVSFTLTKEDMLLDDGYFGMETATFNLAVNPLHGDVTSTPTESGGLTITYTHNDNYNGLDTFEYTLFDGEKSSKNGVVDVTITALNDAPVANPDYAQMAINGTPIDIYALANDEDVDLGDSLKIDMATVREVNGKVVGTVSYADDQKLVFTPTTDYQGEAIIDYTISDIDGATSSSYVTVTIEDDNFDNRAPVVSSEERYVWIGGGVEILITDVASDPDEDALSFINPQDGLHGTVTISPDGQKLTYQQADPRKADIIHFTVTDGEENVNGLAYIKLFDYNDAPVGMNDAFSMFSGETKSFNVLANDYDVDGDVLSVTGAVLLTSDYGDVLSVDVNSATNEITVDATDAPMNSFTVQVEYTVFDGVDSATAIATIAINQPLSKNNAPIASSPTVIVNQGQTVNIPVAILGTDLDEDQLAITFASSGSVGTVMVENYSEMSDTKIVYTHDGTDLIKSDSFDYIITDISQPEEFREVAHGTVTINIDLDDQPVVANDDTMILDMNGHEMINLYHNDIALDGMRKITIKEWPEHGRLTNIFKSHGEWYARHGYVGYQPDRFYTGTDTFEYRLYDSDYDSDYAAVWVDVRPIDISFWNSYTGVDYIHTFEGGMARINVLDNDMFKYWKETKFGPRLSTMPVKEITIERSPYTGIASIDGQGNLTYHASDFYDSENWYPADSLKYKVELENGQVFYGCVIIEIDEVDQIRLNDDIREVDEDSQDNFLFILDNDEITEGITGAWVHEQPDHGTVTRIGADFYYTPDEDFNGIDVFRYGIQDGDYWTDIASVLVIVHPTPDDYPAGTITGSVSQGQSVTVDAFENLTVDFMALGANFTRIGDTLGTITYEADGTLHYLAGDVVGEDEFTFEFYNDLDDKVIGTIIITIDDIDDPVIAYDDTMIVSEDQPEAINVVQNDDIKDGFDYIEITYAPENGDAWVVLDGNDNPTMKIKYNPSPRWNPDYTGPDTIEYRVYDIDGDYDEAVLHIDVRNDDDNTIKTRDDRISVVEGEMGSTNVLKNDDYTARIAKIEISESPEHGVAQVNLDGTATYFANSEFDGTDEFKYKVTLITGETEDATVTVRVNEDFSIQLSDDIVEVREDSDWVLLDLFKNDDIPDGFINVWKQGGHHPDHGSVDIDPYWENGVKKFKVYYKPDPNFSGIDTWRYQVRDGDGKVDSAAVLVNVVSVGDSYEYNPGNIAVDKDEKATFNPVDALELDFEVVEGNFTGNTFGTFTTEANGNVNFYPGNQFAGSISVEYELFNAQNDRIYGTVVYDVAIFSTNIRIIVDDMTSEVPNHGTIDGFFVQQYQPISLWSVDSPAYYLVSNLPVTSEGINVYSKQGFGYVHPNEEKLDKAETISFSSYGQLAIGYVVGDDNNHTGGSLPVLLTVNHQPQISLSPITPDDPWSVQSETMEMTYDIDVYFMQEGFALEQELFVFDFEEYNGNFERPVSEEPLPEGFELKFVYEGEEYELDQFWSVFDLPYDMPAEFTIDFVARDTMGGVGHLDEVSVLIRNNNPEINIEEDFIVYGEAFEFDVWNPENLDMTDGLFTDKEDDHMSIPLEPTVEVNGVLYDPLDPMMFDPGVYDLKYELEDSHGGIADPVYVTVWIVSNPVLTVEENMVQQELGGYFPTYIGVDATYWGPEDDMESSAPAAEVGLGTITNELIATINGTPIDEIIRFEGEANYEITYVARQTIFDGQDNVVFTFDATVEGAANPVRTVQVTDDPFGDYVLLNDIGGVFIDAHIDIEDFTQYPIIVKYNEATGAYRILTTLVAGMPEKEIVTTDNVFARVNWMPLWLDDIAETYTGDIYGISSLPMVHGMGMNVMKYNPMTGMFENYYNLDSAYAYATQVIPMAFKEFYETVPQDETQERPATKEVNVLISPLMSLAANENAELVSMTAVRVWVENDFEDVYNVLITVDPMTGDYSFSVLPTDQGYDIFMDLAYDETLENLFALGVDLGLDATGVNQEGLGDIATAYMNIKQDLIVITKNEIVDAQVPTIEDFLMNYNVSLDSVSYEVVETFNNDYLYTGAAVMNNDLILSKAFVYEFPKVPSKPDDMNGEGMRGLEFLADYINPKTYIDVSPIPTPVTGEYNFVQAEIEGLLGYSLGASATFTRSLNIGSDVTLTIGYNRPAVATTTFTPVVSPVLAFPAANSGTWTIVGESETAVNPYITHLGEGVFETKGVAGTATVQYELDGVIDTATVRVNVATAPPIDPPDPIIVPTVRTVVGVTLDTDAITLDWGETADPEFKSYDFTETVTGTNNTGVTWSLDDDTFVTVDENGVVTTKDDIPEQTGDITVELTVTTDVGGATATATIIFEEQIPLAPISFFDPYISGYTDGSFRPKNYVTRAEVSSMFATILKLNVDFPGEEKFTDVKSDHWAYAQIQATNRAGLLIGYKDEMGDRYFDPEAPITRAEIAQVFTNYWNFLDISVTGENNSTIPDVANDHWAAPAINRIYNTGIFTGFDNGIFMPEDPTLREQIVNMINVLIQRPANNADESKFNDVSPDDTYYGDIEAASQTFLKPQGE